MSATPRPRSRRSTRSRPRVARSAGPTVDAPSRPRAHRRLRLPLRQQHRRDRRRGGRPRLGRRAPRRPRRGRRPRLPSSCARASARSSSRRTSRELGLTRVVVAACSPHMHEKTFRGACERAGLNPYLCELVSIREQVSWVHTDRDGRHRQGEGGRRRRRPAGRPGRAARAVPRPDRPGHARRRRRDRRDLGRPRDRRRRVPGPPGGARAVDRRAHGPVRQDVPDPRLRRLHPDPADGHGRLASEHHPPHLERGDRRPGLRRQLHGDRPPPRALRGHRRCAPAAASARRSARHGRGRRLRGRDRLSQGRSTRRSRRPSRSTRSSTWPTASTSRRGPARPARSSAPPGPSTSSSRTRR